MAQVVLPRFTPPAAQFSVTASAGSAQLDASGDSLAFILPHLDAGKVIDKIALWVAAVAGTPPTYTVRVESVTAGTPPVPSGSLLGTNTEGTVTPSSANAVVEATLTADATPAAGSIYAVVINSASATGANYATFRSTCPYGGSWFLPGALVNTTGSYVAQSQPPAIRITYTDGTFAQFVLGASTSQLTIDSGTTPSEVGNVIIPRVPMTLNGLAASLRVTTAAADGELNLYDSTDSLLATFTVIADTHALDQSNAYRIHVSDDIETVLTINATYRVTWKPTTLGDTLLGQLRFGSTTDRKIFLGMLDTTNDVPLMDMYKTSRSGAAAFSDDETYITQVWPLTRHFTSGGGLVTHPGMSGGLRG